MFQSLDVYACRNCATLKRSFTNRRLLYNRECKIEMQKSNDFEHRHVFPPL